MKYYKIKCKAIQRNRFYFKVIKENDLFLFGRKVNKEGDETENYMKGKTEIDTIRLIEKKLIEEMEEYTINNHYAMLEKKEN